MATILTGINISQLPQINSIQSGDFLVVEAPDGTGIIDFADVTIDLNQTSFEPTINALAAGFIALSSNYATLSSNIYTDLESQIVGNVAVFKNISTLSATQLVEGTSVAIPFNYIETNNISTQQSATPNVFVSCGDTTLSQSASAFVFNSGTYRVRVDARVTSLCSSTTWVQLYLNQDTIPVQVLQHGSSFAATGPNQVGNLFIDGYFYLCRSSQIAVRMNAYGLFNVGLPTHSIYTTASANPTLSATYLNSLSLSTCNANMTVEKVSDLAIPAINRLSTTL